MDIAPAVESTIHDITHPYQVASDLLGPSKIATYLQCPMAYKLRYVDRVPTPVMAPAALGSAIHAVIRYGHEWGWTPRNVGSAAEMLEAIWMGIDTVGADDPDITLAYRSARDKWLGWYLWWQQNQETVMVEERWQAQVEVDDCDELDGGLVLQGSIDRVYREGLGYVVSDVKSGARAPSESQMATHLQLSLYAWAWETASGRTETPLEIVHLRGGTTHRTRRSSEYLERVLTDTVIPVARAIAAGLFPAHPGGLYGCDYCVCNHACAVGQVAAIGHGPRAQGED